MFNVAKKLPIPNSMCRIKTNIPHYSKENQPFRFVKYSDDLGYFWDNLIDEILQDSEVTHWEYWK